jgi:hypothetical protein
MKNSREIIIKGANSGTQTHDSYLWDFISTLHEETADEPGTTF